MLGKPWFSYEIAKEEIIAGLRIALERGEPLQKAMQSFVNAGHPIVEVEDAARDLQLGATGTIEPAAKPVEQPAAKPEQKTAAKPQEAQKPQLLSTEKPKKKMSWKVWTLIIVLGVLIVLLLVTMFFGEQILKIFG